MPTSRTDAMEILVDAAQAAELLRRQFPKIAALPLIQFKSDGTDNIIYRLGSELVVRFPRFAAAGEQARKEYQWLPKLSGALPLQIPQPVGMGQPDNGYPFEWIICNWIDGETALAAPPLDREQAARDLSAFIKAIQCFDTEGGPLAGVHNFGRGVPLALRDSRVRKCLAKLGGIIDTNTVEKEWDAALATPVWGGKPVWLHGDIHPANLLVRNGAINAVIDFGGLGLGDPACDLIVAWNFLDAKSRRIFREEMAVDDASWARGRGWALSIALIALPYYLKSNPSIVKMSLRVIDQILGEA